MDEADALRGMAKPGGDPAEAVREEAAEEPRARAGSRIPEGLWMICPGCREIVYRKEVDRSEAVCPKCGNHFRVGALARVRQIADAGTFRAHDEEVAPGDPLGFSDARRYPERLRAAAKKSGRTEAILCGSAELGGRAVQLCSFDFDFMGGSMGSVAGERIARAAERALERREPLIIVSCSGGARMQEGLFSLMQMAKTAAALARLGRAGVPYLSVLADPTTGGVSASFAMLGDVILAEPGALIGFAGPRVIEQTIGEKLPEGFQRSEFLLEHGLVDMVVERGKLRETLIRLLSWFAG